MTEIDIKVSDIEDTNRGIARLEAILRSHGLSLRSCGTLKTLPGCTHWHWNNGNRRGTLEVTLWPAKRRLWFKVQAGRRAGWIDQIIPVLKADLEKG